MVVAKREPNGLAARRDLGKVSMGGIGSVSMGCRLNACESQAMEARAAQAGMRDVVIVNTCAVTAEAARQSRQAVRRIHRVDPKKKIIVTGCAAQLEPRTFAAMGGVAHVLDNTHKTAAEVWRGLMPANAGELPAAKPRQGAAGGRVRAFVAVQNGCNHRCTFCIIPYGRGDSRSVPAGRVVDEIKSLVEQGKLEVVLTGVDLTSWGEDLPGRPRLGSLVQSILRHVPDLPRLRISSLDCAELDPLLLEALGEERVMPHIHLSLQSGSDLILKRMKRRHLRADSERVCEQLRTARADIVIGADLIAGFPTETEQHFADTAALFADFGLTFAHIFAYSPRAGTPASRMPQLEPRVINRRARRLRAIAAEAFHRYAAAAVGSGVRVLRERDGFGHSDHYLRVSVKGAAALGDKRNGDLVRARVTGICADRPNQVEAEMILS